MTVALVIFFSLLATGFMAVAIVTQKNEKEHPEMCMSMGFGLGEVPFILNLTTVIFLILAVTLLLLWPGKDATDEVQILSVAFLLLTE